MSIVSIILIYNFGCILSLFIYNVYIHYLNKYHPQLFNFNKSTLLLITCVFSWITVLYQLYKFRYTIKNRTLKYFEILKKYIH